MRLIDKLPFVKPSQDKYILISPDILKFVPKQSKSKIVFPFAFGSIFYRGLAFNGEKQTVIQPFEKVYQEEVDEEKVLEELGKEIIQFLERKNLNLKDIRFGTYIPIKYGILRLYSFPRTLEKKELINAIELYIQQEINEVFSGKEVMYSYDFLQTSKDEPYKVLVSIVERDIVQKLINFGEKFSIKPELISFEPVCILNFGLMKNLPIPFTILYTDINKIVIFSYQKDRIIYEIFPYIFSTEVDFENVLNLLIWDIRNYIVLNDLSNLFLAGIVAEYEHLTQYFLEKLPIFGIVSIDEFPDRYALTYTLGERLLNV